MSLLKLSGLTTLEQMFKQTKLLLSLNKILVESKTPIFGLWYGENTCQEPIQPAQNPLVSKNFTSSL